MTELQYCPGCDEPLSKPHACGLCGWKSLDEIGRPRGDCDRPMCRCRAQIQFVDSDGRPRALCWRHYDERRERDPREAKLDQVADSHPEWRRRQEESPAAYRERMLSIHKPMMRKIRERMVNDIADEVAQKRAAEGPADERWFHDHWERIYGVTPP